MSTAAKRTGAAAGMADVPRATYRLQFHRDFDFADATALLPYLQRLGISHVYCSPLMRANPGSLHGYDVVAYDEINPELGGREGFDRFSAAAHRLGLGLLLDIVPNHMGTGPHNAWWMDVLENGQASPFARFFDIDWHPVEPALDGKVLLPVLGAQFGRVLDDGELTLAFEPAPARFVLRYADAWFPIDPRTSAPLLRAAQAHCGVHDGMQLGDIAAGFAALPARDAEEQSQPSVRQRDKEQLQRRLAALVERSPAVLAAIERAVSSTGEAGSVHALDALHGAQAYRLAYWRVASDEINYRRFFDVNSLVAMRMEEPAVFEATHDFTLRLAAQGLVDGLRIDHPDGLYDPAQYFERLQDGYAARAGLPPPARDQGGRSALALYVVAEKIVASHEDVPENWAVHGTTGYRFVNVLNGVLIDAAAHARLDRIWRRFSGESDDFAEMAYRGKREIMRSALASELGVLARELLRIARAHRHTRDYTLNALRDALAEVAACMPVYRTYIVVEPSLQDRRYVDWAVAKARRRTPGADAGIFDFLRQTLLGQAQAGATEALSRRVRRFAMRFQQFTSPVAAKGVEDTAFYRYLRLLSLNEVGGEPGTFGTSVRGLHAANAQRALHWPHTLIATSTHDNKRSEDVRCRLDVLSEMTSAWRLLLRRVSAANQLQRLRATPPDEREEGVPATIPSHADEMLLLQTLLGTLPAGGLASDDLEAYRLRIERIALKSAREARQHTSWISPDPAYEDGLLGFVRSILGRVKPNPVLTELQAFADLLAWFGAFNSASLVTLKFTSPGVPDLYQGNEMLDLSLVDPDNRRPVDYAQRRRLLDEMEAVARRADWRGWLSEVAAAAPDGRLKLWLTWRLLQVRREYAELYRDGDYTALQVRGSRTEHVVAFARTPAGDAERGELSAITIAARLHATLLDLQPGMPTGAAIWHDTSVELPGWPEATWLRNELTGELLTVADGRVALAQVFATLPVAVLVAAGVG